MNTDIPYIPQHNVVWLDVAVDDATQVKVLRESDELCHIIQQDQLVNTHFGLTDGVH